MMPCRLALLAAVVATAPALAQDARTLAVRTLAATCGTCHGTDGRAVPGATVPGLAGVPAAERDARSMLALARVGLSSHATRPARTPTS